MKLLLVDNGSRLLEELEESLQEHEVSKVAFQELTNAAGFDAVILSGGSSLSVMKHEDEYKQELSLIRRSLVPMFGICLGFELISYAFGEKLSWLEAKRTGVMRVKKLLNDPIFKGVRNLDGFEAHRWGVKNVSKLIPLGVSKDGIEMVRHPERLIYGVQFHPEMWGDRISGYKVLNNFLDIVKKNG
ncbi:MAG: hypothetical protein AABX70_00125 [Nanoarchaeota archaeon]